MSTNEEQVIVGFLGNESRPLHACTFKLVDLGTGRRVEPNQPLIAIYGVLILTPGRIYDTFGRQQIYHHTVCDNK